MVERGNIIAEDDFGNVVKISNGKIYAVIHDVSPSKIILCSSMREFNEKAEYYSQEEKDTRFLSFCNSIKDDSDYEYLVTIKAVAKVIGGKRVNPRYISGPLYNITKAWKDKCIIDEDYLLIIKNI
jgi:hypothetical protein